MMAEDHYSSSPEVSSCYAAARRKVVDVEEMEEEELGEEVEEELELGLSLGAKKNTKANNNGGRSGPWREYCRILTAKDFPSMVASRVSPNSSSASSSFSLVGRGGAAAADGDGDGGGSNVPSQVVGWPPIRSYRINNLFHQPKDNPPVNNLNNQDKKPVAHVLNIHHKSNRNSNAQDIVVSNDHEKKARSRFVKVNMDGVLIGRKVDLNAHQSYETLALVLEDMFQSPTGFKTPSQSIKVSKLLDGSSEFVLTYEDKDGDWMLVGDVPWRMFLSSVRRLRIMRTSDGNGLAPRFHPTTV